MPLLVTFTSVPFSRVVTWSNPDLSGGEIDYLDGRNSKVTLQVSVHIEMKRIMSTTDAEDISNLDGSLAPFFEQKILNIKNYSRGWFFDAES